MLCHITQVECCGSEQERCERGRQECLCAACGVMFGCVPADSCHPIRCPAAPQPRSCDPREQRRRGACHPIDL
eukprot:5268259-Prymnesium_polylepis.1